MEDLFVPLIALSFNVGVFFGLFTSRFVTRKQCDAYREVCAAKHHKIDEDLWKRINDLGNILMGGKAHIEIKLKTAEDSDGSRSGKSS